MKKMNLNIGFSIKKFQKKNGIKDLILENLKRKSAINVDRRLKMSEEFDLSNCITEEPQISYIPTFKVKEFIRLLKEETTKFDLRDLYQDRFLEVIDKLARKELKE